MKSEQVIKDMLKEARKELHAAKRRFECYESSEDMEIIIRREEEIGTLAWLLSEPLK